MPNYIKLYKNGEDEEGKPTYDCRIVCYDK